MVQQIARQQVRFLRQRIPPPHIAFLQRRTRSIHVIADLPHRLSLLRAQRAPCQLLQLIVSSSQQLFRVLAFAGSFRRSHSRYDLRRRLARSTLANHNPSRSTVRRGSGGALAALRRRAARASARPSSAGRTCVRFVPCRARRPRLRGNWGGLCRSLAGRGCLLCRRSGRSLASRIFRVRRVLLARNHSCQRETHPKRKRKS